MTFKKGAEKINHFWPLISSVATCFVIVCGGVFASGRNVEKMRNDQKQTKASVVEVQKDIAEVKGELPKVTTAVKANRNGHERLTETCKVIGEKLAEDKEQIKALSEKVQGVREEMSSMKTQQKADSEWIKRALQRIEAKQ